MNLDLNALSKVTEAAVQKWTDAANKISSAYLRITDAMINSWNMAAAKAHGHSNKAILDQITSVPSSSSSSATGLGIWTKMKMWSVTEGSPLETSSFTEINYDKSEGFVGTINIEHDGTDIVITTTNPADFPLGQVYVPQTFSFYRPEPWTTTTLKLRPYNQDFDKITVILLVV